MAYIAGGRLCAPVHHGAVEISARDELAEVGVVREDVVTDQLEKQQDEIRELLLVLHRRRVAIEVVEQLALKNGRGRDLLRVFVVGRKVVGVSADFRLPTLEKLGDDERAMLAGSHRRDGPLAQSVDDGFVVGGQFKRVVAATVRNLNN
jgi:hypothetical protein